MQVTESQLKLIYKTKVERWEWGQKFIGSCNLEVQDILALGVAGSGSSLINRILCLQALFLSVVLTSFSPSENSSHQNEGLQGKMYVEMLKATATTVDNILIYT